MYGTGRGKWNKENLEETFDPESTCSWRHFVWCLWLLMQVCWNPIKKSKQNECSAPALSYQVFSILHLYQLANLSVPLSYAGSSEVLEIISLKYLIYFYGDQSDTFKT